MEQIYDSRHNGQEVDNAVDAVQTTIPSQLTQIGSKLGDLESKVIYDVSANNANTKFASLSALLSSENLSTLIPIAVRCGGMSIRFVQTSDNKYVQYRLMADSFSTTVSDWQGVDDEPTAGSENLVKSEGVASINGLYSTFASKYNTDGSTLEIKETVDYSVRQIEIEASEGDNFRVFGYGGISERLWAFVDNNNNILSKSDSYIDRKEFGEETPSAPQGTVKAIFSCYTAHISSFYVIKNGVIKHISDTIVSLKDITDILGEQLVSGLTWEVNDTPNIQNNKAYTIILGETPSIETKSHYCCAVVENLRTGDVININGRTGSSYVGIAKVSNGVVTEIYKDKNTTFSNVTLICDGSYDSIYINDYTLYTALTVSVVYKFTLKEKIQEQQIAIKNNRNDIDELKELQIITVDKQATTESNKPYVLSVGSAPSQTSASSYTSSKIDGLRKGDKVVLSGKSGSSYVGVALVKNDIVTSIDVAADKQYNKTIICDGTFDSIYANSYNYYAEFSAIITLYRTVKEITTEQIGQITELRTDIDVLKERKKLMVLCIGNSFTQDSMGYVPFIFKNLCPDVELTLGIAFIGGSPLAQHCAYFCNETIEIGDMRYYVENNTYKAYNTSTQELVYSGGYTLYKSVDGRPWIYQAKSVNGLLSEESWDIITFQQSGTQSILDFDTYYAPYIFKLHCSILDKVTHPLNFGWISIHGSYGGGDTDFYNKWVATTENSEKIMKKTTTKFIFPYGTAIQNLRTTPLKDLGDGTHHNLTVDNAHIQDGIGCLCAAYSCTLALMKMLGKDTDSIFLEPTVPTEQWLTDNNVPGVNLGTSGVIGISDANDKVAQAAAISSIKLPYELTDMSAYYTNMV